MTAKSLYIPTEHHSPEQRQGRIMNAKPLCLQNVSHTFGSVQAIQNLNLEIAKEEFVAIVGPSGCGKTTLLNLLSGHDRPTQGTIVRSGAVRMVYQHGGLFPWLTVTENIELGLRHIRSAAERTRHVGDLLALI